MRNGFPPICGKGNRTAPFEVPGRPQGDGSRLSASPWAVGEGTRCDPISFGTAGGVWRSPGAFLKGAVEALLELGLQLIPEIGVGNGNQVAGPLAEGLPL